MSTSVTQEKIQREAWRWPASPRKEARQLVQMLGRNGDDIRSLRALICITDGERAKLRAWADEEPELVSGIEQAIAFRDAVLREFDRLVAAQG
jgi:phage protein U